MLLLGLAALLTLVSVGAAGTVLTERARDGLRDTRARIHPPLRHLDEMETHVGTLATQYLRILTITEQDQAEMQATAALIGRAHQGATDAWDKYRARSLRLPGEAAIAQRLRAITDIELEHGTAVLVGIKPVPTGDARALAERLALIGAGSDSLSSAKADVDELIELYDTEERVANRIASDHMEAIILVTAVLAALTGIPLMAAFVLVARATRHREREAAAVAEARQLDADRNDFEARLQRAFDMVHVEEATYPVVDKALVASAGGMSAELLVADSSRAHLRQVAATADARAAGGCPVTSPTECPAAQRAQTQIFPTSQAIDACPYLRDRPGGDSTAVCVPVSIAGKTAGVVHATTALGEPVPTEAVARLELVARKAGDRLGMLRAFARSETQARTDPLTGLLNRRSLESESREVVESGVGYTVAFGDLDHFKQLNDVHGHDAGDRALRLFARVLRDTVRPQDIPARYGGEEFVIVLPACSVADATAVVERVRSRLAESLLPGSVPRFTVSFGVAGSDDGARLADVIERADVALLGAKAAGRDRTVVSGAPAQLV